MPTKDKVLTVVVAKPTKFKVAPLNDKFVPAVIAACNPVVAMVIVPGVLVVIVILAPATKFVGR